ncbi:MAG: phosphatidate cytidylyltransferase [Deltaproteobacteria bacterium]|nr:phosphatidate cytidylyltransferase [Deltaproteobacteria bacterium]
MRWITGIPLAIALVALLFFAPVQVIQLVVAAVALIACYEFLSMCFKRVSPLRYGIGFVLIALGLAPDIFPALPWDFSLVCYLTIVLAFLLHFPSKLSDEERFQQVSRFFVAVFYCLFLFGFLIKLIAQSNFLFWVFLAMAPTFVADTMAYLVGRRWGKNKLAPNLSPGKSIEGVVGGVFGGIAAGMVVSLCFGSPLALWFAGVLGGVIALLGVVGDLSESLVKRACGVKDSGKIIPGHGGILDRVDALLFTVPFIYFVAIYL